MTDGIPSGALVLVIGAAGFLGSYSVDALVARELSFEPSFSVENGLRQAAEWYAR